MEFDVVLAAEKVVEKYSRRERDRLFKEARILNDIQSSGSVAYRVAVVNDLNFFQKFSGIKDGRRYVLNSSENGRLNIVSVFISED